MVRKLRASLDQWIAGREPPDLPTRRRIDRHVLRGARILAWALAGSLLLLHLPAILFAYDVLSVPSALLVAACGLSSLVGLWLLGGGKRENDGENLGSVVLLVGAVSLLGSSLVPAEALESHVLLLPIPITLLSTAAIAPIRPRRMLWLGGLVFAAQLALTLSGAASGSRAFHVLALTFTFNTVLTSTLICHVRRMGLEQLYGREAELRASTLRQGELIENLRRAQTQLVASERMATLGRLGAGLAHEIKTPLATVSNGLLELRSLAQELHQSAGHPRVTPDDLRELAADMMQAIRLAERAGHRASLQLDGVVSRARKSTPPAPRSMAPLREVRTVAELYEHQRQQLGVNLEIDGDPSVCLEGDKAAFAQVVSHLLDRALRVSRASDDPRVRVEVRSDARDAVLEVRDAGPPLSPEDVQRLFRPVADADEGVGLYVTRDVVEQTFGGRLAVESVARGNVFTVRIPLRRRDTPPKPTTASMPGLVPGRKG